MASKCPSFWFLVVLILLINIIDEALIFETERKYKCSTKCSVKSYVFDEMPFDFINWVSLVNTDTKVKDFEK